MAGWRAGWSYDAKGLKQELLRRADFFGIRNVGTNYGLVFLAWGAAGILGPKLGGRLYDQFQSYTRAFDIAAILLAAAWVVIFTLRPPQRTAR